MSAMFTLPGLVVAGSASALSSETGTGGFPEPLLLQWDVLLAAAAIVVLSPEDFAAVSLFVESSTDGIVVGFFLVFLFGSLAGRVFFLGVVVLLAFLARLWRFLGIVVGFFLARAWRFLRFGTGGFVRADARTGGGDVGFRVDARVVRACCLLC